MKKYFLAFCFLFFFCLSKAQVRITIADTLKHTIYNLAQTIAGKGVKISNITYKAAYENDKLLSIGTFSDRSKSIGFGKGVLFSTGKVKDAEGPNNTEITNTDLGLTGDTDLKNYLLSIGYQVDHTDVSFIAFDFVPVSDSLQLNFVLASEHYPLSQNTQDIFVVLLSTTGMPGYQNIATVAGISPFISPYSIHCGEQSDWTQPPPSIPGNNCDLFRFNPQNSHITQFNGYTVPVAAKARLNTCQSYHIKIIIGDLLFDDSGVFIEPGHLGSQSIRSAKPSQNDTVSICNTDPVPVFTAGSGSTTAYRWFHNDTFTGITTQTITASSIGEYKVVSTISGGCTWTDSLWVRIGPAFTLTSAGITRCTNDSLKIAVIPSAADTYFYEWLDDFDNYTKPYQMVRPDTTTSYQVTVTNQGGCTIKGAAKVNVNPVIFSIDPQIIDSVICYAHHATIYSNVTTTPSAVPGNDNYTISYLHKSAVSGTGHTLDIVPTITGTYKIILQSSKGCRLEDSARVRVIVPSITVSGNTAVCKGNQVLLSVAGATTYLWQPSTGLSNVTVSGPVAAPLTNTIYTVTGFTATPYSCSTAAQIKVSVHPPIQVNRSPDSSICIGSGIKITASGAMIIWNNAFSFPADSIFYPVTKTIYDYTAKDIHQCTAKDSITIHVKPVPVVKISAAAPICRGDSATLKASGADTYLWSAQNNFSSHLPTPVVRPSSTITYHVEGSDTAGCKAKDSVTIKVYEITLTGFITASANAVCRDEQLYATLSGPEGYSYLWMPVNKITKNITVTNSGNYYLTLTDINHCKATDTIQIKKACTPSDTVTLPPPTEPPSFKIPNVFTPNGDDINDYFQITALEAGSTLIIFNRWGQSVFESGDYDNTWSADGQPDDLYYYRLLTGVSKKEFKGWIQIMR